ncbi:probable WRKY transcription factor 2 [Andrographis paniculata]|uniref:probable WRKY transcription factor 2 n=1 Tax=Andrographis paniculata TaxID=175694 RepID=UPI0021E99386|nr:probable WRKY transcription factor 2 [Andrographis paniculata]XP_051133673.1 probable WRKY transcription factor 2 [Andrographis paniculata]XP_051133674.1 probable WRKY transcription factor 2 [Andrographis paniculata]XP_051133675.1 probable WRKY transcription factor 2 [Andrographis paniculata]
MGGFDEHGAIVGDWMLPSPSPRSFFSSMMSVADDVAPQQVGSDAGLNDGSGFPDTKGKGISGNADQEGPIHGIVMSESEPKMGSSGGLMDRIAARAGFNAPRLNTDSFRLADLSKNPDVRSPYLTIPPGLSPTNLLESPVFVNNSLVQPSPTTGKFSFAFSGMNHSAALVAGDSSKGKENAFDDGTTSFAFKPNLESESIAQFNAANKAVNAPGFGLQSFPGAKLPVPAVEHLNFQTFPKSQGENRGSDLPLEVSDSPPLDEPQEDDGDRRSGGDLNAGDDGYNWRKYGQKQVKGSEFPRSYYKCTHPNCPTKKKVERSLEGHITEIIYKGTHNHPKPQPNRRSSLGSSITSADTHLDSETNGDPAWSAMQKGNFPGAVNWGQMNVEATASSVPPPGLVQSGGHYEPGNGGVDRSCTFSNDDDEDDRATHGSVSLGYDGGEGDESESKRRRIETYTAEMSGTAARAIREPRVVVQTTSEVDILDDGYRWRKYGQKVVKGNPNPRSYYKCTSPGCNVRKHVERASHDLKSVITTYEGKHNHDVPAARNNSHMSGGAAPPSAMPHRPEPSQLHRSGGSSGGSIIQRPAFGLPGGMPPMAAGPGQTFGFGISQTMGMAAAMGHNSGRFSGVPGHSYFGQQSRPVMNDAAMGFMLPKAEPKMEPVVDSSLGTSTGGGSGGSSGYQQFSNRMPLGPQM